MKRIASLTGLVLGTVCLVFFGASVMKHRDVLQQIAWNGTTAVLALASLCLYIATYAASARSWQIGLRLSEAEASFFDCLWITSISQIGKYAPGNVGQHIGRVVLARQNGIEARQSIGGIAVDALLLIVSALICSMAAFQIFLTAITQHSSAIIRTTTAAFLLLLLLLTVLLLVRPVRAKVALFFTRNYGRLTFKMITSASIRIIALHASSFILGALALWCVLQMMGSYPLTAGLVGVYATAWLIGFLVPGAPAGLGIREALLLTGLGILYGAGSAAMGAVLLRAVTVAGDGLAFAAGLLMRRYRSLPSSDSRAG